MNHPEIWGKNVSGQRGRSSNVLMWKCDHPMNSNGVYDLPGSAGVPKWETRSETNYITECLVGHLWLCLLL